MSTSLTPAPVNAIVSSASLAMAATAASLSLNDVQLHLVQSLDDAFAMKEWASQRRETPLAFDTETSGIDPARERVRLVQLGDEMHGWAVPFEWAGAAIEVMREYDGGLVAHNSGFDIRHLESTFGFKVPWHKVHDTMTIAALTDPTRPKGLKPLSARLIDPRATAGQKLLDDGMKANGWTWATVPADFPPYVFYAALDPVLTARIYRQLAPHIFETCPEAYDLERAVTPLLCGMMDAGLLLDRPYVEENLHKLRNAIAKMRAWLRNVHGVDSLMSARQIDAALSAHGIEVSGRTSTGMPSITKEVLDAIAVSQEVPEAARDLARIILRARHAEKLAGTYLENFLEIMAPDGAIHPAIQQLQARTGRSSCTDPNLQNLPRDDVVIRGAFIPHPGNALISVDASQIELRIAAHVCQDQNLIAAIQEADENGTDIYATIATMLFGTPVEKKDPRRQATKSSAYTKIYGGGVKKIAMTIGLPYADAKRMNDMFDERFPMLTSKAGELVATARHQQNAGITPHTRTDTGRYLPCDPSRSYALLNYLVQATAAEELKRAITRLGSAGFAENLRLPVHDEVILEVKADEADDALKRILDVVREDHRYAVSVPWDGAVMRERWVKS